MEMTTVKTRFTGHAGVEIPLICGPMYPCSNPELVAAVSGAGGLGVVQPVSMEFVFHHPLRHGLRMIRRQTDRPIGFNALIEKMSRIYDHRMRRWIEIALEEGVRFFVTALGSPGWVVDMVHPAGGVVYHDVTERKWALKARDAGVDGLIAVNDRAGGHSGTLGPEVLLDAIGDLGLPVVCAGGVGDEASFVRMFRLGYDGVQMGTRFIATTECRVHADYKEAIIGAMEQDIVLTDKISGVPCSVIRTPYVSRVGTRAGPLARRLLRGRRTKRWMRGFYSVQSLWKFRQSSRKGTSYLEYYQAGKSVAGVKAVLSAAEVVRRFGAALDAAADGEA